MAFRRTAVAASFKSKSAVGHEGRVPFCIDILIDHEVDRKQAANHAKAIASPVWGNHVRNLLCR